MNEKGYKDFIREVIYNDPEKILLFKQKLISDDLWEIALDQDATLFRYVKNPSTRLCYYALELDGANLQYIDPDRVNSKMVAIATRTNREAAAPYIPKKFITEDNDIDFYANFEKNTKPKDVMLLEKIRRKPNSIKDIENPSEELICEAIKGDPNIYLYYRNHTPAMKNVIEEYYPTLTSLFPGFENG